MAAIVHYVHNPPRHRPMSHTQICIEASQRVKAALLTKSLWQLEKDLDTDELGRRFEGIGFAPNIGISRQESAIRDQMIQIVKERRFEERVLQGKATQAPAKEKKACTSWCRNWFGSKCKEIDPGLKTAERIANARVYQALVVEKKDKDTFELGLCEERRRLWAWGVKAGQKHAIIAYMLDIIQGRRKLLAIEDTSSIHSQAAWRLGKALPCVVGDEQKLENVYRYSREKLKAEGLEDGEEYETLGIMIKMIHEGREKAKLGNYGAGF